MTTTINRLRVRGMQTATPAYRLVLTSSLGQIEFQPSAMPPAAILIVRRLTDPLPGRFRPDIGARVDRQWQEATRQAMQRLYSRAAWPINGPASNQAEAICFADEAELLACLALDMSLNRAAERWWWRSFRGRWGGLGREQVAAALAGSPRLLPAVFASLDESGDVLAVAQAIPGNAAAQVLALMCTAFALLAPRRPAAGGRAPAPDSVDRPPAEAGAAHQQPSTRQPLPARDQAAHWSPFALTAPPDPRLPPETRLLVGIALTLARSPALARSPQFTSDVERWWTQQEAAAAPSVKSPTFPQVGNVAPVVPPAAPPAPSEKLPTFPKVGNFNPAAPPAPSETLPTFPKVGNVDPATTLRAEGIATGLGGVLFLLNLMQQLDLPACFEQEWRLASQVGPWGTLELLARGLLVASEKLPTFPQVGNVDLAADPLWSALAALAGRSPDEPAAASFSGPDQVQIPSAWARWLGADGRVGQRIDLAAVAPLSGPLLAGVSREMRRWLAALTPLIGQMLAAALGDGHDPATHLLLRRGQLYVTASHVDLALPLEAASLPVRIAGLDFDPGWLPQFGRVVRFHYGLER